MGFLPLWAGWTILFVLLVLFIWALARQWKLIRRDQEGLLMVLGDYQRTLGPGRHFINPQFTLIIVPAGTTQKFHVGQAALVVFPISGPDSPGRVQVGPDVFEASPARRGQTFEPGSTVRIVAAKPPMTVYVRPAGGGKTLPGHR